MMHSRSKTSCLLNLLIASIAINGAMAMATTKIRVCQGSSCLSKCRGAFNPLNSLEKKSENNDLSIELEETYCMNQCKRGPNARIIHDGNALTFDDLMNETEAKRKAFQGISNEKRVEFLWGIAEGVENGKVEGKNHGSVDALSDIMP